MDKIMGVFYRNLPVDELYKKNLYGIPVCLKKGEKFIVLGKNLYGDEQIESGYNCEDVVNEFNKTFGRFQYYNNFGVSPRHIVTNLGKGAVADKNQAALFNYKNSNNKDSKLKWLD